jgi:hypothetical protein
VTGLSLDHFLWECQGTEVERDRIAINKDIWQTGLARLAKLIEYTKKTRNLPRNLQNDKDSKTHIRQGTGNPRA